jgi:hypothetical protein
MIVPDFGRFTAEAGIIGRLLAGYGELELELSSCVGAAIGMDIALRKLFSKHGAEKRIELAKQHAKALYNKVGLEALFDMVIADIDYCRKIRNQYAHCHWYGTSTDGLGFMDLEAISRSSGAIWPLEAHRRLIDAALLQKQEAFFKYVQRCFWYLVEEYQTRVSGQVGHKWSLPTPLSRPPKHL